MSLDTNIKTPAAARAARPAAFPPQVMHAGPQHQALLPAAETPKPWETVVAATYANLKNAPVLFSRGVTGGKGRWVRPGEAVVMEEVEPDGGGGAEERAEHAKRLTEVLLLLLLFCVCGLRTNLSFWRASRVLVNLLV